MSGIYCWGCTVNGELGLGGIPEEQITVPRKLPWDAGVEVKQVSCGASHTLFLLNDGKVYSCGNNDNGQLGHELSTKRPRMSPFKIIAELENSGITYICAGGRHSHALSDWGQIFSWGDNNYGQLGLGTKMHAVTEPKLVRALGTKIVVQIACGYNHTLALTNCGELYAWGSNIFGQLGVSPANSAVHSTTPVHISSLDGIPIAFIACGSNHSFVVSKSGAVFGWGRNDSGQLGLNDNTNRSFPTQLTTLRSLRVRYVACGDDFSVFLTNDGGVFTCGSGSYGQLGHGGLTNEALPRMVIELMGSVITQIACGLRHTLALVPSRGRVYGFGLNCSGQLGNRLKTNSSLPQVVVGPWVSPSGNSLISDESHGHDVIVKQIFCGGNHSLVTTTYFADIDYITTIDCRIYEPKSQILHLTRTSTKYCAEVGKNETLDLDFLANLELIFKSQACLNASFLLEDERHMYCTPKHHGVDFDLAANSFEDIRKIQHETLKNTIFDKLTNELIPSLKSSPADVETLRVYLILPLYHEFVNTKNYEKLHTPFSKSVMKLRDIPKKIIRRWWAESPIEWFEQLVSNYKNVVGHIISFQAPTERPSSSNKDSQESKKKSVVYDPNLVAALDLLAMLHEINNKQRSNKIHYETFYYDDLADHIDIQEDYLHWVFSNKPDGFNICRYPFIFNGALKTSLLQTDQAIQMHRAIHNASQNPLSLLGFVNPVSQFVVLEVSRENLVADTLREIMRYNPKDLKKPLKVKFHGEEAEDAGGVRKEFFLLLLKEILDPKYGMFKEYEDSRAVWFADTTFETEDMYFLIGVICGLAIYNFTIIHLPFPLALYKKILNVPVELSDLRDLSPVMANSMQALLDYDGDDLEQVFCLNFEISRDNFGDVKLELLKPNGNEIPVTQNNKKEFVDLYIDYIFNKSVELQFKAFHKGFAGVCWGRILQLFQPEELMATMVGNEDYDWLALEMQCEYKNGYTVTDPTIKMFWEVFHELSEQNKRKFLLYLTGCDRIPIQGMKEIAITIQPTKDDKCLPVAHTCFNLLDLPRYKTKERLKYKLLQALEYPHGFSLV